MFNEIHNQQHNHRPLPLRLRGARLITNSGARLVLAATRIGGDEGAALACAFKDMVADTGIHPLHWPLEELIELFRRSGERRDLHIEQIVERLEHLRHEISRLRQDTDAGSVTCSTGTDCVQPRLWW